MTGLKTLRELEEHCCGSGAHCTYDGYDDNKVKKPGWDYSVTDLNNSVHSVDLRAEAVKRVKHFQREMNSVPNTIQSIECMGRIRELMEFNNLTEEDLR